MNNKGNAIQIVLMMFSGLLFFLSFHIVNYQYEMNSYKQINKLMFQKNLEIFLIDYYINTMKESTLYSDYYEYNDDEIYYYVDDMGDYYAIDTFVRYQDIHYCFLVHINTDDFKIEKYEYNTDF